MATLRLRVTALSLFCSAAAASGLYAGAAKTGSTEGSFVGIEQGDYAHFLLKDKKGQSDSFIILSPDKSVEAYLNRPSKMKGRRVRVFWEEKKIPEAGNVPLKTVVKVESAAT